MRVLFRCFGGEIGGGYLEGGMMKVERGEGEVRRNSCGAVSCGAVIL